MKTIKKILKVLAIGVLVLLTISVLLVIFESPEDKAKREEQNQIAQIQKEEKKKAEQVEKEKEAEQAEAIAKQEAETKALAEKVIKEMEETRQTNLNNAVATIFESGLVVKTDYSFSEFHVEPLLWQSLTIDQKEQTAQILAKFCADKCEWERSNIMNAYTGKEMASFKEGYGFTVK